jgi:putative molybdopterin biosynthesis protein
MLIMKKEGEFYTASQIAEKLQVNIMTIYRYIEKGKLNAYKFGKEFRISLEDFEKFLNSNKVI